MQKLTIWAAGMALATLTACASQPSDEADVSISKAAHNGISIGPASFLVIGDRFEDDARIRCIFTPNGDLKDVVYEHTAMLPISADRQGKARELCKAEFKGFAKSR